MTIFEISALILCAAALGGYINTRFIGLPVTIGYMAFTLLLSGIAVAAGQAGWLDIEPVRKVVEDIDFTQVIMHGMLSFLLFAGALHVDLNDLKSVKWPVGILATVGVLIAAGVTGSLIWVAARMIGIDLPYVYALLFGALISPTDPIAVMSLLKQAKAPKVLSLKIGGESLFNDGVGVVTFVVILETLTGGGEMSLSHFAKALVYEGIGGLGLGIALGWLTFQMMRTIDDYKVEVMLTLALVTGGYALAESIHVSAPLCMVAAGLIIGNHGRTVAMSDTTRNYLDVFWELVDEVLNAVLFLLIGLEIMIVPLTTPTIILGLLAMLAVLGGRFVSVALPITVVRMFTKLERGTIRLLTWGGMRGGLSIAMALSLPPGDEKNLILTLTYIVVLLSIFVQGLTFKRVLRMVVAPQAQ